MAELAQIFGLPYSDVKIMHLYLQKNGWATFWATFSKAHLVTLSRSQSYDRELQR
jgi:hypothetical protein